jgi:hypothetical protein
MCEVLLAIPSSQKGRRERGSWFAEQHVLPDRRKYISIWDKVLFAFANPLDPYPPSQAQFKQNKSLI